MLKAIFYKWLASVVLLGATLLAHAQPTTYVGTSKGNYTTFTNHGVCNTSPCQNFTTAMSGSGVFTTSAPLAPNLTSFNVVPLLTSYSFSDGLTTYSNTDPNTRIWEFMVTTNGSGAITNVVFSLERWFTSAASHAVGDRLSVFQTMDSTAYHNMNCTTLAVSPAGTADSCSMGLPDLSSSIAEPFSLTWTSTAPAPATAASIPTLSQWGVMLLAGLMGLFALVQMRRGSLRSWSGLPQRTGRK